MPEQPGAGRLDAETLAAYVDGLLPPEERAKVEEAIAADPETYEWVVNTVNAVNDPSIAPAATAVGGDVVPRPVAGPVSVGTEAERTGESTRGRVLPFYRRRWFMGGAGSLVAAAAALLLVVRMEPEWWQRMRGSDVDPRFAKLVEAVGEERYIEARLTGGFKYGPLRQVLRGAADLSKQNLQLLAAAGELQRAAEKDPSPDNLHAWGVAQLLLGDYTGAIAALERSAEGDASNPALHSDTAAALIARAGAERRASDWPMALAAADRALRLAPADLVARFNRALALENLFLRDEAIQAWQALLQDELSESWRAEIRSRLDRFQKPGAARERLEFLLARVRTHDLSAVSDLAGQFPRVAREFVEDTALPRWGELTSAGSVDGSQWLALATALTEALSSQRQADSAAAMVEAARTVGASRRLQLARAESTFGEARTRFVAAQYSDSRPWLETTIQLARGHSPALEMAARAHLATTLYYDGRLEEAATALVDIERAAQALDLKAIQGRCHWVLGIIRGAQSRFSDSIRHYVSAGEAYSDLGELDLVATSQQLLGDAYAALGDHEAAWFHLRTALAHWQRDWNPPRHLNALMLSVLAARRAGQPEIVLEFQRALTGFLAHWPEATAAVESLADAARAHAQLGDIEAALRSLGDARKQLLMVSDPGLRRQVESRLLRVEALVWGRETPGVAVARLSEVARFYEASGAPLALADVYQSLAEAHDRLGNSALAEDELEKGVDVVERNRRSPPTTALRVSYFDGAWGVYRALVEHRLATGHVDEGLSIAELGRARTLGERLGLVDFTTETLTILRRRLSTADAIVFFCELRNSVAVWIIKSTHTELRAVDKAVLRAPGLLSRAAEGTAAEFDQALRHTYSILWRPLEPSLGDVTRVYVVPDGPLAMIPYAALYDDRRGEHLVTRLDISVLPSLRFLGVVGDRRIERPSNVLVVASTSATGSLPALPGAAAEAELIAEVHSGRPIVDGLTPVRFREAASTASLVHFAGHAVANAEAPGLSRLVLSDGRGIGDLYAHEIEQTSLRAAPTVVLSACSTGSGVVRAGEGVMSLVRPFLAAGASSVVASLWPVPDREPAEFMTALHSRLRAGHRATQALSLVQRDLAKAFPRNDVRSWARFVAFEGLDLN